MKKRKSELRIDKTKLSVVRFFDQNRDKAYWLGKKPAERVAHIEYLRRINYGDSATSRLQRVLEFAKF